MCASLDGSIKRRLESARTWCVVSVTARICSLTSLAASSVGRWVCLRLAIFVGRSARGDDGSVTSGASLEGFQECVCVCACTEISYWLNPYLIFSYIYTYIFFVAPVLITFGPWRAAFISQINCMVTVSSFQGLVQLLK